MEAWSDPLMDQFRIKFYLDTNILVYLVDETHPGVTKFTEILKGSEFCDPLSSKFAVFEFIGVRKLEYFYRHILKENYSADDGDLTIDKINLSSLLKYKQGYKIDDITYDDAKKWIKKEIEDELKVILNEFDIDYEVHTLHNDLLDPTFDVCLNSRIAKADSLIACSASFPDADNKLDHVVFMTNDQELFNYLGSTELNSIFESHGLTKPKPAYINNFVTEKSQINLLDENDIDRVEKFTKNFLKKQIIEKNNDYFLGKSIKCAKKAPDNTICFKLGEGRSLKDPSFNNGFYLTIIGKGLDFIYNTRVPIKEFWNYGVIKDYPHSPDDERERKISFLLDKINESGDRKPVEPQIMNKLKVKGNLVFINPDN